MLLIYMQRYECMISLTVPFSTGESGCRKHDTNVQLGTNAGQKAAGWSATDVSRFKSQDRIHQNEKNEGEAKSNGKWTRCRGETQR